jgi:PAS domain-containing protein
VFESLFEQSSDAIWLYDPKTIVLLDCNQAAVKLMGAETKEQFLRTRPEEISPEIQPDGMRSAEKAAQIIAIVERENRNGLPALDPAPLLCHPSISPRSNRFARVKATRRFICSESFHPPGTGSKYFWRNSEGKVRNDLSR